MHKAFDALDEAYTALDALCAKDADNRLGADNRGELKAVALSAVNLFLMVDKNGILFMMRDK